MQEDLKFIQRNSPDGGFLQSDAWAKFQAAAGSRIFSVKKDGFWANIITHRLPVVGKYFYVPRGPVVEIFNSKFPISNEISNDKYQMTNNSPAGEQGVADHLPKQIQEMVDLAKKERAGWIRIEPATEEILAQIKKSTRHRIVPAPHDMQPKELFVLDITKPVEQLLGEMKAKTRYNIKLAEKKGVKIFVSREEKDLDRFFELVEITARRQGVVFHAKEYYQKMVTTIPEENIQIFCAEFEDKIVAANLVLFFGDTATYLHGASDDAFRHVMAPYLLQWQQIQAAQAYGAKKYDFGGVKTTSAENAWAGITRFKQSFSPQTQPLEFPGSFDIIVSAPKYLTYRIIQKIKSFI